MSPARWSDIVAKIEADGGPITSHPDAETARRLAENPPKHRSPVLAPKDTFHEAPLQVDEELPAPIAAQPYPAESTETRETIQPPAENESPEHAEPVQRLYLREMSAEQIAEFTAAWDATVNSSGGNRAIILGEPGEQFGAPEPQTSLQDPDQRPALEVAPAPNPPSRRGWRRLFRRVA